AQPGSPEFSFPDSRGLRAAGVPPVPARQRPLSSPALGPPTVVSGPPFRRRRISVRRGRRVAAAAQGNREIPEQGPGGAVYGESGGDRFRDTACAGNGWPGAAGKRRHRPGVPRLALPVDDDGLDVERLESLDPAPRLVYVTPTNQCPLGMAMSLERRFRLLEWARKSGAYIFEDDYDGELPYAGPRLPGLPRT